MLPVRCTLGAFFEIQGRIVVSSGATLRSSRTQVPPPPVDMSAADTSVRDMVIVTIGLAVASPDAGITSPHARLASTATAAKQPRDIRWVHEIPPNDTICLQSLN